MKFIYQYRTSDNVSHRACVSAASKADAYALLKSQGIKPSWVDEAPGFFNKLFGKGKRWIAIVVLGLALVGAIIFANRKSEPSNCENRAQLFGDPVVIAGISNNGWSGLFFDRGDQFLAAHAIPGKDCKCPAEVDVAIRDALVFGMNRQLVIFPGDLAEVAQMKRMLNGMKKELCEYIAAGGTAVGYMRRLEKRQRSERAYFEQTKRELSRTSDERIWRKKNADLRAMGLPMVSPVE